MKAKTLRDVINDKKFLVLPGVYDCLTAKLAEQAGAQALFLSGGALSIASLGRPDIGFLNLTEFVNIARNIVNTVDIPLIADADNGFGNAIHAANTAKAYEHAGLAGMQIDDQILPQTMPTTSKECLEWEYAKAKIQAVRESVSSDFVLIFRTIANITDNLDEAILRVNKAAEAGADYVYVDGLKNLEEIERVARHTEPGVKLLINMNEKGAAANISISRIKELGYKIGLFPVSAMSISAKAAYEMFTDLMACESTEKHRNSMFNPVEIYNMMGLTSLTEKAQKFYS